MSIMHSAHATHREKDSEEVRKLLCLPGGKEFEPKENDSKTAWVSSYIFPLRL
jgi:hypothetical protein